MFEVYFAAINLLTFTLWGIDKVKATARQWRIPEKMLYLLIIAGGGMGALSGMLLFRHKTRKPLFRIAAMVSVFVYLVIWAFVKGII